MDIQDLVKMLQVIDNSAKRGAIYSDELFVVGQLREKIRLTVQRAQEESEAKQQEEAEPKKETTKKSKK